MTDLFPRQKSLSEFSRERHGGNYVYAARRTPRIVARYGADVVVITRAMQKQLQHDYLATYGKEAWPGNDAHWKALCALRAILGSPSSSVREPERSMARAAIAALTGG